VQQLEIYALLKLDEGQLFLCAVERRGNAWDRRQAGSHIDLPPDKHLRKNSEVRLFSLAIGHLRFVIGHCASAHHQQ
jgi:hypothetical protein